MSQLGDTRDDPARAVWERDELRELAVGTVVATMAMTVWAVFVVPDTSERVDIVDLFNAARASPYALAGLAVFVGSLLVGMGAWILVIEQRRPWPFGPRRGPWRARWETVLAIPAMAVAAALARAMWPWQSVLPAADPDAALVVHLPENMSRGMVLTLATASIVYVIARLVAQRVADRRRNG